MKYTAFLPSAIISGILCLPFTAHLMAEKITYLSHPAQRIPVLAKDRPMATGPAYFVNSNAGDDSGPGSKDKPWKTIQASLKKLKPGDTLYLRGGIYYEHVYCAIVGDGDAPITIRSFPSETAIIDGGLPEFQVSPETAWEKGEADGEYISTASYPNIRDVVGIFGDSNLGLQTYWYREDMIATGEVRGPDPKDGDALFYYCGPGLYYDKKTGKIHARLAHTTENKAPMPNYSGETDPRKLPLVIVPFASVAFFIDQGMHLRFQDLIIRGGGFNTVQMRFAIDVEFDHVSVYGGSYCVRSKGSGPVKWSNCGIYGQLPPWSYLSDNALHTYEAKDYAPFSTSPGMKGRNISRLPTHALLVTEGAEESDIFYYPFNNRWEIANCEFADGHDGVYLNGQNMWMHHCWIDNMQDDATFISSPTPGICDDIHYSQNYISKCTTAFGAHTRGGPDGKTYLYGNIIDMRFVNSSIRPMQGQTESKNNKGASLITVHGGKLYGIENITFAFNTVIIPGRGEAYAGRTYLWLSKDTLRNSFDSIYVYLDTAPGVPSGKISTGPANIDGNLHFFAFSGGPDGAEWIRKVAQCQLSLDNEIEWKGTRWDARGAYGDPQFVKFNPAAGELCDFALQPSSPAANLAVEFPEMKSFRGKVGGKSAGALQAGETLRVGIEGRIIPGQTPPGMSPH